MIASDDIRWRDAPQPTGADGLRVLPVGRAGRPSYVPPSRRPNVHRWPWTGWAVAAGVAAGVLAVVYLVRIN